jgi:hypothetical protein
MRLQRRRAVAQSGAATDDDNIFLWPGANARYSRRSRAASAPQSRRVVSRHAARFLEGMGSSNIVLSGQRVSSLLETTPLGRACSKRGSGTGQLATEEQPQERRHKKKQRRSSMAAHVPVEEVLACGGTPEWWSCGCIGELPGSNSLSPLSTAPSHINEQHYPGCTVPDRPELAGAGSPPCMMGIIAASFVPPMMTPPLLPWMSAAAPVMPSALEDMTVPLQPQPAVAGVVGQASPSPTCAADCCSLEELQERLAAELVNEIELEIMHSNSTHKSKADRLQTSNMPAHSSLNSGCSTAQPHYKSKVQPAAVDGADAAMLATQLSGMVDADGQGDDSMHAMPGSSAVKMELVDRLLSGLYDGNANPALSGEEEKLSKAAAAAAAASGALSTISTKPGCPSGVQTPALLHGASAPATGAFTEVVPLQQGTPPLAMSPTTALLPCERLQQLHMQVLQVSSQLAQLRHVLGDCVALPSPAHAADDLSSSMFAASNMAV